MSKGLRFNRQGLTWVDAISIWRCDWSYNGDASNDDIAVCS